MHKLIVPAIHLAILIGFLVYLTKAPFMEFIRNRHKDISEGLNKSKKQAADVDAKKREVEAKLAGLDQAKQQILAEWKEREVAQVKAIQEGTQRILAQMKSEAEKNKKVLEEFYHAEALKGVAARVLALAEESIRQGLNAETHRKLNERFTGEIVVAQPFSKALEA